MLEQNDVMKKEEAFRVNPVTLAFIGDAVYTLYVREKLVRSCEAKPSAYQASAAKILSAVAQSAAIEKMISAFTEDEAEVYRRGRNAKKATKSKHASVGEYNRSTGLEAVIGYLYLSGEKERINELLSLLAEEDFSVKTPVEPYKGQR